MKIGMTCYPTYGGSGIVATELGMELATRGHEIHFITYGNPIRLDTGIPGIHYHEVEVVDYPLFQHQPYTLALASRMSEVIRSEGLDLLHVHYAIPHAVSALLAQSVLDEHRRVPYITTLHGTDITLVGLERAYFPITRFSIQRSDGVTTTSRYLADKTRDVFGIEKKIHVVPNFVNCELYKPRKNAGYAQGSEKILIHISNFRPVKRILDCIQILKLVRKETPARLLMVGDGPDRKAAEALAQELGLSSYVEFLGKQEQIHQILLEADILLLPSELEGFGLVALEAMACGVPAVATQTGGVPEVIQNGIDSYMELPGDITAQAAKVGRLLQDEDLYSKISREARKTALKKFCATRIIPLYESLYKEISCPSIDPNCPHG